MGKNQLTIREVQRRQKALLRRDDKKYDEFVVPFLRISEMLPRMFELESYLENVTGVDETIQTMIAACIMHLADYCNAKKINFANIIEANLIRLERMKEKANNEKTS